MALPIVFAVLAICSGVGGIGAAASGGNDLHKASKIKKENAQRCQPFVERQQQIAHDTEEELSHLGKLELEIYSSFSDFSDLIEKIQSRPEFLAYTQHGIHLPPLSPDELRTVAASAKTLLGTSATSAISGTLSAIAVSGAIPSVVTSFCAASTGTAISSLSGAAATNAVLAAIGGGSIVSGGGGVALGSMLLKSFTGGIGILIGGITVKLTGKKALKDQKKREELTEETIASLEQMCCYLNDITQLSMRYREALSKVRGLYEEYMVKLRKMVVEDGKSDWEPDFSSSEKKEVQNLILLVDLLQSMCRTPLEKQSENNDKTQLGEINEQEINALILKSEHMTQKLTPKPSFLNKFFHRK